MYLSSRCLVYFYNIYMLILLYDKKREVIIFSCTVPWHKGMFIYIVCKQYLCYFINTSVHASVNHTKYSQYQCSSWNGQGSVGFTATVALRKQNYAFSILWDISQVWLQSISSDLCHVETYPNTKQKVLTVFYRVLTSLLMEKT